MSLDQITSQVQRTRIKSFVCAVVCGSSSSGGAVTDFNGRTGSIVPIAADYDAFFLTPAEGNAAYQPLDSDLTAIAALSTTSFGRAFLALADQAAALSAVVGFNPSRRIIYKNNAPASPGSVTGTLTETVLDSVLIPANTFASNDVVLIHAIWTKSGTAGSLSCIVRRNTQANGAVVAGSTVIGQTVGSAANLWVPIQRHITFKNSISSEIAIATSNTTSSDYTTSSAVKTSLSIDFSQAQYIFLSAQLANTGDTATLESWFIEAIRT